MIKSHINSHIAVDIALLIARLTLGIIFVIHGSQKLFGAFGGPGLSGIVQELGPVGYLVTVGEFFGGLGIVCGFLSRFSACAIAIIMIGAIVMVHAKNGFFLPDGFEYPMALLGLALTIAIAGPGDFAIGYYLPLPKSKKTGRIFCFLE